MTERTWLTGDPLRVSYLTLNGVGFDEGVFLEYEQGSSFLCVVALKDNGSWRISTTYVTKLKEPDE